MASGNRSTTFTVNIDANIKDLLQKSDQAKSAIGNIFNTSNLGQSLKGDFNKLEKILTRIQNTASGPIRSDWGAENLIADFSRAGLKLDDMISKLEEIKKDKNLRIDILSDSDVQDFNKVLEYNKKLGEQLQKNKKTEAEIVRLQQEQAKAAADEATKKTKYNQAVIAERAARGQLTKTQNKYGVQNYTREEFKQAWTSQLAGFLTKSGEFNALGTRLGLSKSLLNGNDYLDVKSIIAKASAETVQRKNDQGITVNEKLYKTQDELNKLEETLNKINDLKKEALTFEVRNNNVVKAQNELSKLSGEYTKASNTLAQVNADLAANQGKLSNTFNTQEWKEFEQIAQQVGVDISNINSNSGIDEIQQKVQEVSNALDQKAVTSIDNVTNHLRGLSQENKNVQQSTEGVIDVQKKEHEQMSNVNAITNRIKMFTGFYGILNLVRRSINSAISTIKELDEQMTKMAVVTSPSISDYWKQLPQYTKRANALGAAIKEVYEADTLYYQQGLKTNQVIQVSNETMKMARIAALDAAEATDRMTSAMRGFNMEINETSAQRVNDVYSQLAAITASDVNEISVAMTKTASIAHSAGMEFETTAAFLSQIIETTRESADTAGTALKTIIARFEELKKSPNEIGEIDGEVVDANKIEKALRSVGIALRDTQGQFRDLDDVFLELAQKWDSLDKNTQRYIATIAAGSRQQSRFIAMMQNYAHTTELVAKANGSAGASQKQFEKTLDSMKTKLNALKNAWDTFTMGILDSDFLKGLVSMGTTFMDILNKIGKAADAMNVSLLGSVTRVALLVAGLRTLGIVGKKAILYLAGSQSVTTGGIFSKTVGVVKGVGQLGKSGVSKLATMGAARKYAMATNQQYADVMSGFQAMGAKGHITGSNLASGAAQGVTNLGSSLKSLLPTLAKIGVYAAAIIVAIKAIKFAVSNIKGALQSTSVSAEDALKGFSERLDDSKKKLDEVKNDISSFKELKNNFDGLVVGTNEWKEALKEVNTQVMELLQKYPLLAQYVSKTQNGELTIDKKGLEALQKEQEKTVYFDQKRVLKAQERVYNQEASDKSVSLKNNFKQLYEEGERLFDTLNSKSTADLQNIILNEDYAVLTSAFGETENEIRSAVNAIYANKIQTEKNTEALEAQKTSVENLRPEGVASDSFIEDYVSKYAKKYADAALADMNEYGQYEKSAEFKKIIKAFGGDVELIKGKSDKEVLAYASGLVQGINDFDEAVEQFKDACGFWAGGITDPRAQRRAMENIVVSAYGKKMAEEEAAKDNSEAARNEERLKKNALLYNLLENPEKVTKKQYENLRLEDIQKADIDDATKQRLIDKYFSLGYAKYDKKGAFDAYKNYVIELSKGDANYEGRKKIIEEKAAVGGKEYWDYVDKILAWAGAGSKDFSTWSDEQEKSYSKNDYNRVIGDRVNEGLNFFADDLRQGLINLFNDKKILSADTEAKLTNTFKQIFLASGTEGAKQFQQNISEILNDENLTEEQKEELLNIFSAVDVNDLKALEDIRKTLKEKYPDVSWIDKLIDDAEKLGDAVRKVDLASLATNIESFFKRVRTAVDKNFSYNFSEEEKKQYIATGAFSEEDFFKSPSTGDWIYKGTEEAFTKGLEDAVKSGRLDQAISQGEIFNKYFKDKSLEDLNLKQQKSTYYYDSKLGRVESVDWAEDNAIAYSALSQAVEEGLIVGLSKEGLDKIFKENDFATITKYLEELSTSAENLTTNKEVRDNLESYTAQNQYAGVVGHNLIKNGKLDEANYEGLLRAFSESGDVDKQRVDQLKNMIDEFNKAVAAGDAKKIERLTKDINQFSAELGGSVGASNAEKKIRSFFNSAKAGVEKLDDGIVKSKEDIAFLEQALSEGGMKIGTLTQDNAQMYADLMSAFTQGSYEAYEAIVQIITLSEDFTLKDLDAIQQGVNAQNKYLADYLEKIGLGWQENGKFNMFSKGFIEGLNDEGKGKDEKVNPWENPYDWLWNITEQINKTLYQRERLERKYKLAVDDTAKSAEDLYDISKKELSNLEEQARLQSLKGQKATEEAQLLLSHYKEYAKYVSMNPLTGQVQVAYEELDKKGWSQEQGSAFEAFVSRLTELASEIKDSNTSLEEIEDEVKEIQNRGRDELIALQNRVKDALVTERQREIDTLQEVNEAISNQQSKLLEAMQQEIEETRRIRENTDRQEEIEKKRQRLSYLQRDTSGANQTEILSLQEEIENDTISYQDSLIDQSLQKMQEDNELAAEKRQEQVDIMNNQLARWTESGEIWNTVGPLLEEYFGGDNGNLQGIISDAENWQALTALEKADLEDELYNNGQLAKLFNEGDLYKAADGTRGIVQNYTNTMAEKITKAGVLGNEVLDKGNYLKVTLKDFTPKVDDTNSKLGSLNSSVNAIYQWLQKIKLTESGGNLANATQSMKALATAGTTATANTIKAEYQSAVEDFVSLATGSASLGKEEAINKVSDAIQMNKDLANYLRNEYHTENFDLVAKNLLTHAHYKGFSTGGLVTETGPAWLHGTPSKPEYVLNAKQTDMLFESLDNANKLPKDGGQSSGGDNYFNVTVNVDEIANDYGVDKAIARVKQSIIEDSNYRNVNFISGFTY